MSIAGGPTWRWLSVVALVCGLEAGAMTVQIDPITRYLHVTYAVPDGAPEEVQVRCTWWPPGGEPRPARVMPLVSETGLRLVRAEQWKQWTEQGLVTERRAAGLPRTLVVMPYPEMEIDGRIDAQIRVVAAGPDGAVWVDETAHVEADNQDVLAIDDWTQVHQRDAVATGESAPEGRRWWFRTGLPVQESAGGTALIGRAAPDDELPPLSYPLALRGWYAVFVCAGGIGLWLSGDERTDRLGSPQRRQEVFWRWARLDRQHLVISQLHTYAGYASGHLDTVRFVPLSEAQVEKLEATFAGPRDKLVAGYWEPYSWAFEERITRPAQHREPLLAYRDASVPVVDAQLGRFGMKVVYESRLTDQLLHDTIGDPVAGNPQPRTTNVGRMQQYTNTLETELAYARELGLRLHANFGASNCYVGTPLEGDVSKEHPDWRRGHTLRFELPEVQDYALALYREALEIGAMGVSIDFCRYPEAIDRPETATAFLRRLRALADEYRKRRGEPVPILVRFPGTGVRLAENFDYVTWVREGLVDYLCPSNIQGRHCHIDPAPYLAAARGTATLVMPSVDGLGWGLPWSGPILQRVRQLYAAGCPGIHIYQCDARVLGPPADRRTVRLLGSSAAVERAWAAHLAERPRCSKGVYLSVPGHPGPEYNRWERLRIWTEGLPLGEMELYLDGELVQRTAGPPYLLGTEEYESDGVIPPGPHTLRVRVRDGDGWYEEEFAIQGAG